SYLIADPDTSLGAVGFPRPESIVFQIGLDPITLTTRFVNPAGLRSLGKNLFSPTNVSGGYNATTGHPVLYTNEATVIIIANATREGARAGIVFADPRPSSSTVSTGQESWTNLTVEEGNVISIVGVAGGSVIGEESPALHEYGAAVGVNVPEGSEPVSYSIGLTSETIERVRDRYLSAHLKSENASQLFG
ncbi:MAG: hypothetical protein GWN00_26490, partial [Aliifodinibius sp.]|nr:hypothetical protein [Fodinibius sp.]NIV14394.1 hypothetical protein [Fodinibius sp.]NIY28222.1 hypothetical protein [Fodinibius sp.]